jgi:hypothetical protein
LLKAGASDVVKRLGIVAGALIMAFAALWALAPWVAGSLLAAVLAPVLSGIAFVANLVVPIDEKNFRVETRITVDGSEHRAVGIATCRRLYETYGAEKVFLGRRLKIFDGHVSLTLPDGRQVQSSAFLVCSDDEFAKVKDRIAFYLVDRRSTPVRAQYTSVPRSAANSAAAFRVEIVAAGPTRESRQGPSHLPDYLFAVPPAIDDVRNALASYITLPIPKEVWSTDETEFRAVPKPPDEVLRRLVAQTDRWPASGTLAPDHSRVDLPAFGPPLPVDLVAVATKPPPGYVGPPFQFPVPQICLGETCVPLPLRPYERESIFGRQGYLFDPASQTLIAIRATFAGIYDPGKATFMP